MTRETRIGLLVGLVLVVMFGLVLSELTGKQSTQPVTAAAKQPQSATSELPPLTQVPELPPVATPAAPSHSPAIAPAPGPIAFAPRPTEPALPPEIIIAVPEPARPTPPGEIIVMRPTEGTGPIDPVIGVRELPPLPPAGPTVAVKAEHIVAAGDTLTKIARKYYGKERENDFKVIVAANPQSLPTEKAALKLGAKLVIPELPAAVRTPAAGVRPASGGPAAPRGGVSELDLDALRRHIGSPSAPAASPAGGVIVPVEPPSRVAPAPTPAGGTPGLVPVPSLPSAPPKEYIVQEGDNLGKIAQKLLNSSSRAAITKLVEANKDKLSNPDRLKIGDKLVVPS